MVRTFNPPLRIQGFVQNIHAINDKY